MCYDISFTVAIKELADYFPNLVFDSQLQLDLEAAVHIMGHAYGEHPIIYRNRDDGALHCRLMEWGCIPYYIKDEEAFARQRASMLNARSERILDDPKSYWYKIRNRRCLIPVSGIYEHRSIRGWKKKVPYFIQLKGQPLFCLPGLYSVAELVDKTTGELVKHFTYTLITRGANKVMSQIHNSGDNQGRMPLFLNPNLAEQWLSEELTPEAYQEILGYEMPSEALAWHTVYTIRSGKTRPDNLAKNAFFEWEKLPELGEMNPL